MTTPRLQFIALLLVVSSVLAPAQTSAASTVLSPRGDLVARAEAGATTVGLFASHDGTVVQRLAGHGDGASQLVFSEDGSRLLTVDGTRLVRVWSVSDGSEISRIEPPTGIRLARLSPDGLRVATLSQEGVLGLWYASDGEALGSEIVAADVDTIAFSRDGARLLVAGRRKTELRDARNAELLVALTDDATEPVRAVIEGWRRAWSAGDAEAYLAFYAPEFSAAGATPQTWRAARRARVRPDREIDVELVTLRLERVDADRVSARFAQVYRAEGYADRCQKRLELAQEGGQWRIVSERTWDCARR